MKDEIKKILQNYVDDLADVEIDDNLELISGGFIDSFDVVNLISEFEEAFQVTVPFDDFEIERFETVSSIAQVMEELQK